MKRALLLGLLLLAACAPSTDAWNEPAKDAVVVRSFVDRASVSPGVPFTYTVQVDRAEDAAFELPDPSQGLAPLEVVGTDAREPQRAHGRVLFEHTVSLRAPRPGVYEIPGVEAAWRLGDTAGTAGSGPILVQAEEVGGAATDDELRDIKPPAPPDRDLTPVYVATAAGLAVALLGFLVWRLRRPEPPPPPAEPPAAVARRALSELESTVDGPQGPFAYAVSAILRRYLEGRFGFRAWRMTTPEVLRALPPELARDPQLEQAIRSVLEASDRVKFAGEPVPRAELTEWLTSVRRVVDRTPPPAEAEA